MASACSVGHGSDMGRASKWLGEAAVFGALRAVKSRALVGGLAGDPFEMAA